MNKPHPMTCTFVDMTKNFRVSKREDKRRLTPFHRTMLSARNWTRVCTAFQRTHSQRQCNIECAGRDQERGVSCKQKVEEQGPRRERDGGRRQNYNKYIEEERGKNEKKSIQAMMERKKERPKIWKKFENCYPEEKTRN